MDLKSEYPFWLVKNGLLYPYSSLQSDEKCDVAIIGAGITGALCAYYLTNSGFKVVVVEKRHVGMGSTSASTALLQYEIDTPLKQLLKKVGHQHACMAYQSGIGAINELKAIAAKLPIDCGFKKKESVLLASTHKDAEELFEECTLRNAAGIDVVLLNDKETKKRTGINAPASLLSKVAASADAYRLCHGLLQQAIKNKCRVYDTTEIKGIVENAKNATLTTKNGKNIHCSTFIFANGYESQLYLKNKCAQLHSTYAMVSKTIDKKKLAGINYLLWETADPYCYLRTTDDNRIIIGGKDETFYSPGKRDKLIKTKSLQLLKSFDKWFPHIDFQIDFSWAGTFAVTKDGLPFIGNNKEYRHALFALGFGGNGITFSQIAARVLTDKLTGTPNDLEKVFSFNRTNFV